MKIAVEGCAHGALEQIYETIANLEKQENIKVNLLICCGDFQSTRNLEDLQTMAVPKKFQDMCSFYKYYSGEKVAPILTIFIGGNHEASNYLQELPYGGWVAPNIYYLGLAGVININGIRIAGISGIYKGRDYQRGHFEYAPYDEETKRSVYHVRQLEVFRLKQLSGTLDICISHDWPRGVYNFGNYNSLIRYKPFFKEEIENDRLGSPACMELLQTLQPAYWFAAHLHCKFAALVPHDESDKITKFLALDKCLPKRRFLQLIDIESKISGERNEIKMEYDLEWLAILQLTNHLINTNSSPNYLPGPMGNERYQFTPSDEEKQHILEKMNNTLVIPTNFCKTVEPYSPGNMLKYSQQPKAQINPQTTKFCDQLGIDDPLSLAMLLNGHELSHSIILDASNIALGGDPDEQQQSTVDGSLDLSPLKRKSTPLKLPEPKTNNSLIADSEELSLVNSEATDADDKIKNTDTDEAAAVVALTDGTINVESTEKPSAEPIIEESKVTPSPLKKFKRRNESLYASQLDAEDSE